MRITGRNDSDREQSPGMEWGILAALLLLLNCPGDQSREPRLVIFGPCCGPPARQAEPGSEPEAGG
jgi:hypothetical protein